MVFYQSSTHKETGLSTHPEYLLVSAIINKITGFEKGEIEKDDISIALSRLAPLIGESCIRMIICVDNK